MTMDYQSRLEKLRNRRTGNVGPDGIVNLTEAARTKAAEAYELLKQPSSVKYAVGAMQSVGSEYTATSYEEGNRVKARLEEAFTALAVPIEVEYQGSLPMDVHVKGNSDVDLLLLHLGFRTVDIDPLKYYPPYQGKPVLVEMKDLRGNCEDTLGRRYWACKVDCTNPKCVTLSGGSLARNIDVVPAHWHDALAYQQNGQKRHREVRILDKSIPVTLSNRPFEYMYQVDLKDAQVGGGLKKAIRLLKTLRYDATPEIKFSSYDIAALAWNMSPTTLAVPYGLDLLLVERVSMQLDTWLAYRMQLNTLTVPDGSRTIMEGSAEKLAALQRLAQEARELVADIRREILATTPALSVPVSKALERQIILG